MRPVEELKRKAQIRLLDDDRFGTDVRQLPVGEALACLEVKNLVRLVEPKHHRLVVIGNHDSEQREILRPGLRFNGLFDNLRLRLGLGGASSVEQRPLDGLRKRYERNPAQGIDRCQLTFARADSARNLDRQSLTTVSGSPRQPDRGAQSNPIAEIIES